MPDKCRPEAVAVVCSAKLTLLSRLFSGVNCPLDTNKIDSLCILFIRHLLLCQSVAAVSTDILCRFAVDQRVEHDNSSSSSGWSMSVIMRIPLIRKQTV